jgi:hypothetical protein
MPSLDKVDSVMAAVAGDTVTTPSPSPVAQRLFGADDGADVITITEQSGLAEVTKKELFSWVRNNVLTYDKTRVKFSMYMNGRITFTRTLV